MVWFLLPLVLLAGVAYGLLGRVVGRYQEECKQGLMHAGERLESFAGEARRSLGAQATLVAESKALLELFSDLQETRRRLGGQSSPNSSGLAALQAHIDDLKATLRLDLAPTQARDGHLDLLALVDREGTPLACQVREAGQLVDALDRLSPGGVRDLPLVHTAFQGLEQGRLRTFASFTVFVDKRLYFALVRPLEVKGEAVGLLVVGTQALPTVQASGSSATCTWYADTAAEYPQAAPASSPSGAAASPQALAETSPARLALAAALPRLLMAWHPDPGLPPWRRERGSLVRACPVYTAHVDGVRWYAAPYALWEAGRDRPLVWAVTCQDEGFLAPLYELQRGISLAGVAVLLLSLALVLGFSVQLSRPLEHLTERMQAVGQGDLEQCAEVAGRDEIAHLGQAFNQMVDGLREKRQLAAYVPERARDAIEGSGGRVSLAPKRVVATVLFSDLRGFTTMSERLEPQEVVAVLDAHFVAMEQAIVAAGGYVGDFIGDAVLAVFHGTDGHDGALAAVRAALAMQAALATLTRESANAEIRGLRMGVGVHTGPLVEGDVGPPQRLKFTVLGDTVNTAARIQDASKNAVRTSIVLSEATWKKVEHAFVAESLGEFTLKGKAHPSTLYEVLGARAPEEGQTAV